MVVFKNCYWGVDRESLFKNDSEWWREGQSWFLRSFGSKKGIFSPPPSCMFPCHLLGNFFFGRHPFLVLSSISCALCPIVYKKYSIYLLTLDSKVTAIYFTYQSIDNEKMDCLQFMSILLDNFHSHIDCKNCNKTSHS